MGTVGIVEHQDVGQGPGCGFGRDRREVLRAVEDVLPLDNDPRVALLEVAEQGGEVAVDRAAARTGVIRGFGQSYRAARGRGVRGWHAESGCHRPGRDEHSH